MTELGEMMSRRQFLLKLVTDKYLIGAVTEIKFDSGIELYEFRGSAESLVPASGTPHWGGGSIFPAVYVRQGGAGETKKVDITVKWTQEKCDGKAKLEGKSQDGSIVIEGDFSISGDRGEATVSCEFTKKPAVVKNLGSGVDMTWTITAAGETVPAIGGSPLRLFFVDAKPKPVGWGYPKHYLQVVDWATDWADGKSGEGAVRAALWDKFSDGQGARLSHATGYSYWQTSQPVQSLDVLLRPPWVASRLGWSCRAIAHLFMECLAVNGIKCVEVIPNTPSTAGMFLVQNWDHAVTPTPNWYNRPTLYYGGTWVQDPRPPLNRAVRGTLTQPVPPSPPPAPGTTPPPPPPAVPLVIDFHKRSGVPAQGQNQAPLGFSNHWIVETAGKLYDSSYGAIHANNIVTYSQGALAGWLLTVLSDQYRTGFWFWARTHPARAWVCQTLPHHTLVRQNGSRN